MSTPPHPDPAPDGATPSREGSPALRHADTANGESGTTDDDATPGSGDSGDHE